MSSDMRSVPDLKLLDFLTTCHWKSHCCQ